MLRASILTAPLAPARNDEEVGLLTVDAERRLPNVTVVGAGADPGRELAERVRTAIGSTDFPRCRLVVTLPGDTSRATSAYDLPAALAILNLETPTALAGVAALGELSLSGDVRPVRGLVGRVRALVRSPPSGCGPYRAPWLLGDLESYRDAQGLHDRAVACGVAVPDVYQQADGAWSVWDATNTLRTGVAAISIRNAYVVEIHPGNPDAPQPGQYVRSWDGELRQTDPSNPTVVRVIRFPADVFERIVALHDTEMKS